MRDIRSAILAFVSIFIYGYAIVIYYPGATWAVTAETTPFWVALSIPLVGLAYYSARRDRGTWLTPFLPIPLHLAGVFQGFGGVYHEELIPNISTLSLYLPSVIVLTFSHGIFSITLGYLSGKLAGLYNQENIQKNEIVYTIGFTFIGLFISISTLFVMFMSMRLL